MQTNRKAAVLAGQRRAKDDDKVIVPLEQGFCKRKLTEPTAFYKFFDQLLTRVYEANGDGRPVCPVCGSLIVSDAVGDCVCRCGTLNVAKRLASDKKAAKEARLASRRGRKIRKEMGWAA